MPHHGSTSGTIDGYDQLKIFISIVFNPFLVPGIKNNLLVFLSQVISSYFSQACNHLHSFVPFYGESVSSYLQIFIYIRKHFPECFAIFTPLPKRGCYKRRERELLTYYAALLPRKGPHIASHSVCLSL